MNPRPGTSPDLNALSSRFVAPTYELKRMMTRIAEKLSVNIVALWAGLHVKPHGNVVLLRLLPADSAPLEAESVIQARECCVPSPEAQAGGIAVSTGIATARMKGLDAFDRVSTPDETAFAECCALLMAWHCGLLPQARVISIARSVEPMSLVADEITRFQAS